MASTEEIPGDVVGWDRTILHMFEMVFMAGIERRLASGQIDHTFVLHEAELLQWDGKPASSD